MMLKNKRLIVALMGIMAATSFASDKQPNLYTISTGTVSKTLYYSGTISPIQNVPVVSPTQGVIDKKSFIYGQMVKKGDILLHIKSEKALNSMRDARVAYLKALSDYQKKLKWKDSTDVLNAEDALMKAKRSLLQAKNTYQENQKLYKLGIISRDTLTQSKNALDDSNSGLAQSQRSLAAAKERGEGVNLTVSKLTLANAKEKYDSLKAQVDAHDIKSPATGIVLQPSNNQSSNGDKKSTNGKVASGDTVQYQQVLMNIGDMSGLNIRFSVPEININDIRAGEKAIITGAGFPGIKLSGTVKDVAAQASSQGGGTLPTFPAMVVVNKLNAKQKEWIRSGMDAQISIEVMNKPDQITVPVEAVHRDKKGNAYVNVYNAGSKKISQQTVTVGTVTGQNVQIKSGLKAGDSVVLPSDKDSA